MKALKAAYRFRRKPIVEYPSGKGQTLNRKMLWYCSEAERLTAENLRYSFEDQNRSALEEIIGIAVALGIQQGTNITTAEYERLIETMKIQHNLELSKIREE